MSPDSFFSPENKQSNWILIFLRIIAVKDTKYRPRTWAIKSLYPIVLISYFRFSLSNFRPDRRRSFFFSSYLTSGIVRRSELSISVFFVVSLSTTLQKKTTLSSVDSQYLSSSRLERIQDLCILTISTLTVHLSVTCLILIPDNFRRSLPSFSSRDTDQVFWMKRTSYDFQWNISRSSSSSFRYHSWDHPRRYRWSSTPSSFRLNLPDFNDRIIRIVHIYMIIDVLIVHARFNISCTDP